MDDRRIEFLFPVSILMYV